MVKKIFCAPGNPGIAEVAECVDIEPENVDGLYNFALKQKIDLTVVGLKMRWRPVLLIGSRMGSCIYSVQQTGIDHRRKQGVCKDAYEKTRHSTADFKTFDDLKQAKKHISACDFPLVIKADGVGQG